jgi:hypothetical protein
MGFACNTLRTLGGLAMSARILDWWYTFRAMLQTNRIATATLEECWLKVRSKAAILSATERVDYLRVHAAPLVQQHVDTLVRENPAIPGSAANQLVVKATERLVRRLLERLDKPVPDALGAT